MPRPPCFLAALALLLPLAACDGGGEGAATELTVMTQNLGLGADLYALFGPGCQEPAAARACVDAFWTAVQASDYPARAEALAERIAAAGADVVALQEATAFYRSSSGDAPPVLDFLGLLLEALDARGASYGVSTWDTGTDVTLAATSGAPLRFVERDVILVTRDIGDEVHDARGGRFTAPALFRHGGQTVQLQRGYAFIWATKDRLPFRLYTSRIEESPEEAEIRGLQALDLEEAFEEAPGATIFAGDLSAGPADEGAAGLAYALLAGPNGTFEDAWAAGEERTG